MCIKVYLLDVKEILFFRKVKVISNNFVKLGDFNDKRKIYTIVVIPPNKRNNNNR